MGFGTFKDRIKQAASEVETTVSNVESAVDDVASAAQAVAGDVVSEAQSAVDDVVSGVQSAVGNVVSDVQSTIGDVVSGVQSAVDEVGSRVQDALAAVDEVEDRVRGALADVREATVGRVESAVSDAANAVQSAVDEVESRVQGALADARAATLGRAESAVSDVANSVKSAIDDVKSRVPDVVKDALGVIASGVASAVGGLVDAEMAARNEVLNRDQAAAAGVLNPRANTLAKAAHADAAGPAARGHATTARALPGGGAASSPPATEPVAVEVFLGGHALKAATVWVERVQVRLAVNEIPSATVELSLPQTAHDDYSALDTLLDTCKVGQAASVTANKHVLFIGVIGAVQVNTSNGGRRVKLRLKHGLQRLKAAHRSRVLKKGTDASVVKALLNEHQLKGVTVTMPEGEPTQRVQWNCSDWTLVRALAGQHGAWLWPQATGGVKVHAPTLAGKTHRIAATPSAGGMTVLDAQWNHSGLAQLKQASTQSWDVGKQAPVQKSAKPVKVGGGGLDPSKVAALTSENGLELLMGQPDPAIQQAATSGWMTLLHARAVRAQLTLAGCQTIEVGDTLELVGFGTHLSGKSVVTQLEYLIEPASRVGKTTLSVGLDDEAATAPPLPAPSGLVMGKVAKYQADPKAHWNRLPVTVPMLGQAVLWARMGHPYASNKSGVTFYPEVDDEVALGFVGSDPVILASLHNPKQPAPFEPSSKNATKGIVLRHANQRQELSFDRDKHTAVWAVGKDAAPEQQVGLDAAKGVTFAIQKGDVKVDVKEGGVAWTMHKSFDLKATEHVGLTADKGVKVVSKKDVTLEATDKLTGTGKNKVELSSGEGKLALAPTKATLKANETTVEGGSKVTVKGTTTAIGGAAETSVKGATVTMEGQKSANVSSHGETNVKGMTVKVDGQATTNVGGAGTTNVKGALVNLG